MKLLINIILFGSLFAQSIDSEASETFIESLLEDLNRQRNNSVIKRIDESTILDTNYANHAKVLKLKAYYNLKDFDAVLNTAKSMNPLNYPPNLKTSFYLTLGDTYSSKGYYDYAFKNYLDARRSNIDSRSKRTINKRIVQTIPLNLDFENLELMEILEDDKSNLNIILLAQSFSLVYSNSKEIPNKFKKKY